MSPPTPKEHVQPDSDMLKAFQSGLVWIFGSGNPTITIGTLTISTQFLPILVSAVFIYYTTKASRVPVKRTSDVEKGKPASAKAKESLKLADLKDPKIRRKYIAKTIFAYHVFITTGATMNVGLKSLLPHEIFCITQAIALVIYGQIVQPSTKTSSRYTAVGWLLMAILNKLPEGTSTTPILFLAFLLACPVAWQIDGETNLQQVGSAVLLMMLCLNKVLFASPEAGEQWFNQYLGQLKTVYILGLHLPNALIAWFINRRPGPAEVQPQQDPTWDLQETIDTATSIVKIIAWVLLELGGLSMAIVAGAVVSGLLSACLPWMPLLLSQSGGGRPESAPAFLTLAFLFGLVAHIGTWSLMQTYRDHGKSPDAEVEILSKEALQASAEMVGWVSIILNVLFMVLKVVMWFKGNSA